MTAINSGFLTALECIKFVFGWGSPRPSSWFKEPCGRERGKAEKNGRGRERQGLPASFKNS